MAQTMSAPARVSNPASTGGAGNTFEQHVNAHWLALLLVRGIPPILRDCTVAEVHFQTEHLGWNTDDFMVVGASGSGKRRKLPGQVKRNFTVSAADEECRQTIQDCWKDFRNAQLFDPANDRLAIITLRGTNTLLEHFAGLLDGARAPADAADFERRLKTLHERGLVYEGPKVVAYCDDIRSIIGDLEGRPVNLSEVWPFLSVLHVVSLDLTTSTGQTEAAVKTLLAHTTSDSDPRGAADASWDALVREAGTGMPQARSYVRDTLSDPLRQRHSPVGSSDQRALAALRDHSAFVLDGIRSVLGTGLHLRRERLVQNVADELESSQIVLVTGAAGSGKSAVAKDAVATFSADHFVFSFRSEEFAVPHFDETLLRAQIPARASALGALLAGQSRKLLLVESVERLLEASTRDAFSDLLTLVSRDKSWRLLLTCRDYSADLVRSSFLESAGVGHAMLSVPSLEDAELEEVQAACPAMARPLASASLRTLLRNPYVLDMALRLPWPPDRPLPTNEREFRGRFWQEIVRDGQHAAEGMPRRREQAFIEIALRRARGLTLHARCGDLDAEAIDGLRSDSLIASPPQSAALAAPAHDVLEDWAILQWIEEQHAIHHGSLRDLAAVLGTYPAIRRTYRKWVAELVERDAFGADSVFESVTTQETLPAHFRDDTLVAFLRSATAPEFLGRHREVLLRNDKHQLHRVIHLLRVGCIRTPDWVKPTAESATLFSVPDGVAWASVMHLVQQNLSAFSGSEYHLLIGFIEDWARGVSWQTPYPDGAEPAAAIAHALLPHFDDYRSDDERERILKVLARIPNGDRNGFAALLRGHREDDERDRASDELRDLLLCGMDGMAACRDLPDLVVEVAREYFLCSEENLAELREYRSGLDVEPVFGINQGRHFDFFPASAIRGPFLQLLRYHSRTGIDFISELCNRSADWYQQRRVPSEYVEPPYEIALTFADGTTQKQWCNGRLWNLYRGTSVGPDALQSALMALEHWLLEVAEHHGEHLDGILIRILRTSRTAAVTAVTASVATAFPRLCGDALLVLLSSRDCVQLDRHRLVHESQAPSGIADLFPQVDAERRVYNDERKQADVRPHRQQDLEAAIVLAQFGPFADRLQATLDAHRANLPPIEQQTERDQVWRLALHRMDLRRYNPTEEESPEHDENAGEETTSPARRIRFEPEAPEPDLQGMINQSAAESASMNARLALLMWGRNVFEHENSTRHDPARWRQYLAGARATDTGRPEALGELSEGGPGYVAAVCVRDHWGELPADEQAWCVSILCAAVERQCNNWNRFERIQRGAMSGDRPAAWALSCLLGHVLEESVHQRILHALVLALTHAIDEVRNYAAVGLGANVWAADRSLALRCVNMLATESIQVEQMLDAQAKRPYEERRQLDDIEAEVATAIRRQFLERDAISADAFRTFRPTGWIGSEAFYRMLAILANEAFSRLARTLVGWWEMDRTARRERPREIEPLLSDLFERFLLRVEPVTAAALLQPILDAIDRHPREVTWIIRGLIGIEDRQSKMIRFWPLWRLFADKVQTAAWLDQIDDEHPMGGELVAAVFFGLQWKDGVRHWRSLEGHSEEVHSLFEELPPSSTVMEDYLRFLYHIGEQSLPVAFIRLAHRLGGTSQGRLLNGRNTVFMLEALLRRYVYGRPLELKRHVELRDAVLQLLDVLVDHGSSAAFRMRDDFVTPVPTG